MNVRGLSIWLAAAVLVFVLDARSAMAASRDEPFARTVSVTRQFVVYATDPALPPAVCVFAERVKDAWRDRLDVTNQWRDPIVIVVRQRDAAASNTPVLSTEIFQTEFHLKYQITCLVPPPIDEVDFETAVVETLNAEAANRDQPVSLDKPYTSAPIPRWLSCGLTQSIGGRPGALLGAARRSVDAGRPQSATELMTLTVPAEPAARELFQANAWLFTEELLSLSEGPQKMQRFLSELGKTKSVSNAFWSVYRADFPEPVALEKWWSLERARRVTAEVAANLDLDETSAALDKMLLTTLARPAGKRGAEIRADIALAQLWRYYEQPWLRPLLVNKLNSLQLLRGSAHPLYRVVIDQYCGAIEELMGQRLSRFRRAVANADRSRAALDRTRQQITRYLDEAERVYTTDEFAGMFRNYFRTLDQFEAFERQRSDPISDYLDQFDH
ncbi:MAG TPA: hypothetical protein VLZ12_13555 [Verrucomicrobiae bacterium]|nr:hypothetical protein [Verrucomicrobiae bacterium]